MCTLMYILGVETRNVSRLEESIHEYCLYF